LVDLDAHLPAIVAGDADAFGRWMSLAERTLRDSLRPYAAATDTEAVLQESLLRLWQIAPRFEPDGRPNGLLRLGIRVARNLAVSELRRNRTRPTEEVDLEQLLALAETAGPASPDPLLRSLIEVCRGLLPEKPGRALAERLSSAGGEPDELLAERLGMRLNTFLQNFTRARKMLADCLRERGYDVEAELR
jgi:DNA-directed RNA polymerase specialized sigma24 family protein